MQVTFWGTRGSIAKPGPSTVRYGGNTSCVEVRTDSGTLIVIDCGTGAHELGRDLLARAGGEPIAGHILITHTHWDHIQGIPFFGPLFVPQNTWHIYGPHGLGTSIVEALARQMQYTFFPVTIEELGASVEYRDLVEGTFAIEDVTITTHYLNHPALTLGYRLEVDGASMAYASDHEPCSQELGRGGDLRSSRQDSEHAEFLQGVDLLIHDSQYLGEEYAEKVGWGHSTVEYVVDTAIHGDVGQLALYHHDPFRTDEAVDELLATARARAASRGYNRRIIAAAEGMQIELRGEAGRTERDRTAWATARPALEERPRSVLIMAPTAEIASTVRRAAEAEGLVVFEALDRADALEVAEREQPALIVVEADENEVDPYEIARDVGAVVTGSSRTGVVAVTTDGSHDEAADHNLLGWLLWPSTPVYVRTKLRAWLLRRACRWQAAPVPADEEQRLRSLRSLGVLDTEPEERFDRHTAGAISSLDVPVALVTLVDAERQWFKSRQGLDAVETPREMAFCAHAILDDEVLQVPDALEDPRFAENPFVTGEPRVRFYAGAPLKLSDGTRAGTLCVIDYRPRLLSSSQLAELERLARLVARELETPS